MKGKYDARLKGRMANFFSFFESCNTLVLIDNMSFPVYNVFDPTKTLLKKKKKKKKMKKKKLFCRPTFRMTMKYMKSRKLPPPPPGLRIFLLEKP